MVREMIAFLSFNDFNCISPKVNIDSMEINEEILVYEYHVKDTQEVYNQVMAGMLFAHSQQESFCCFFCRVSFFGTSHAKLCEDLLQLTINVLPNNNKINVITSTITTFYLSHFKLNYVF